MPNLNSVDIFINQEYVMEEDLNGMDKKLMLSASTSSFLTNKDKHEFASSKPQSCEDGHIIRMDNTGDGCSCREICQLTSPVSLELGDSACTDGHLEIILPNLQSIQCLNVSGCFGRMGARKGRVVFCTSSGGLFLNLSPEHKMNQDETKDKVENAHDQNWSTSVCNKWEGII
eukprot:scaffold3074_cov280-Chaetoceros_neogracile.AAC.12